MAALKRLLVVALLLLAVSVPAQSAARPPVIETLSNRADLVSGGDVLVRVTGPLTSFTAGARKVRLAQVAPGRWEGLVTGLPVGRTTLTARTRDAGARLVVTNHPASGPVFAGPQVQPWVCHTDLTGLGPPRDRSCSTPAVVTYQYKSSVTGFFSAYDPAAPPADVATTTTDQGWTVPYVVRVENGVMDRGLYTIAVLRDTWNHKLGSPFGGSCYPRHQQEAVSTGTNALQPTLFDVIDDAKLSQGFMIAHNALGNLGSSCNDVVAAESLMMLKEHIVERYGPIRWTIGYGCSGGSMLQHLIAANYPGLLDGITPACSFPDIWSTLLESEDCHLLQGAFAKDPTLTAAQQGAVTGYQTAASCLAFDKLVVNNTQQWFDPHLTSNCGDAMPATLRCSIADYQEALLGRGNRPYDNTGVVYGLTAYRQGLLTAEQLVTLNENVGGDDLDWVHTRGRTRGSGIHRAYLGGRVLDGRRLADVPVLDPRGTSNQEIHTDYHSYAVRARLDEANGTHANQVIWTSVPLTVDPVSYGRSFFVMDDWLARIAADRRPGTRAQKVARDKPPTAVDSCFVAGAQVTDRTVCETAFPHYGDPRLAAGGRLAGGDLQCALKPLALAGLTPDQLTRMRAVFPRGVCDSSRRSTGFARAKPWISYASGDLVPLGAPPVSTPFSVGAAG